MGIEGGCSAPSPLHGIIQRGLAPIFQLQRQQYRPHVELVIFLPERDPCKGPAGHGARRVRIRKGGVVGHTSDPRLRHIWVRRKEALKLGGGDSKAEHATINLCCEIKRCTRRGRAAKTEEC